MAVSKVILNGTTLIDVTQDTVATSNLLSGETAHDASGTAIVGTASSGVSPTGTINITAQGTHDVTNYASAVVDVPALNLIVPLDWETSGYAASLNDITFEEWQYLYGAAWNSNSNRTAGLLFITLDMSGTSMSSVIPVLLYGSVENGTPSLYITGGGYDGDNDIGVYCSFIIYLNPTASTTSIYPIKACLVINGTVMDITSSFLSVTSDIAFAVSAGNLEYT